jgi:hypothetical protein
MPGRCTYEPALRLLPDEFHNDLRRLRANGYLVCRPLVGLLVVVDERPTDARLEPGLAELRDPEMVGLAGSGWAACSRTVTR